MGDDYSKDLCEERHFKLRADMETLSKRCDYLNECITRKFQAIMFGIFTTLLTVIASLMVMVVKIKTIG